MNERSDSPTPGIGPALAEVRALLGMSPRQIARLLAERAGRSETSLNAQLWQWDKRVPRAAVEALLTSLGRLPPGQGDCVVGR